MIEALIINRITLVIDDLVQDLTCLLAGVHRNAPMIDVREIVAPVDSDVIEIRSDIIAVQHWDIVYRDELGIAQKEYKRRRDIPAVISALNVLSDFHSDFPDLLGANHFGQDTGSVLP